MSSSRRHRTLLGVLALAVIGITAAALVALTDNRPHLVDTAVAATEDDVAVTGAGGTPEATPAPAPEPARTLPATEATPPLDSRPVELDLTPRVRQVELPRPEPLPLDPYEATPEIPVATLRIPALGLEETLWQGMSLTAINRGPSHWPGTALPGQLGNAVIAGHRTTYGAPFRHLDLLSPGDRVEFDLDARTVVYAVTGTEIVDEYALHIADQSAAHTATLFACHPPGSADFRIVVHLELLDDHGRPVDDDPLVQYEVVEAGASRGGALPAED